MELFIAIYMLVCVFLMARMAYVIAKYNGKNKWLWAALTVLFGAVPLAYVFWSKPKND